MALLLLVQAVTDAAPTKQLEVADTVDTEVATKNNLGCLLPNETLRMFILIPALLILSTGIKVKLPKEN